MSVLLREETDFSYPMVFMFKSERCLIALDPVLMVHDICKMETHEPVSLTMDCEM